MSDDPAGDSSLRWAVADLPYISHDLPGTGGKIRETAEDFCVEEIPAYLPEGSGEFLYLWIEKRGLSAEQLTSHLARLLGIAHQDIGMAGLKDRHAVTRQFVSVPARSVPDVALVDHPQIRVLSSARHRNKLRPGHLRGNRFEVVVRDVGPDSLERATAVVERIRRTGFPNYFGDQRFGHQHETLRLGLDLLRGVKEPGQIPRARRKFLLRLALSSVQSALFNRTVADRLVSGTLFQVQPGDVMQVVASGGPFVVEDAVREQARYESRETVIAGPMFGPRMKPAAGIVADWEDRTLAEAGLSRGDFEKYPQLTSGTRRASLIWPADLLVTPVERGVKFEFTLTAGSYATVLLREVMKVPV